MPPHDHPRRPEPFERDFPSLPIVTPDVDRLSDSQKYGGLLYLGIGGLVVLCGLLAWFAWGVWSFRSVWGNVYVLHDASRGDAERIAAAYALSRDPGVNQRQLWDITLRTTLPPLARYVVAEGLTAEAASADPRGYGMAVARSEGWPVWLRLVLTRPLAYRAALDLPVPREPLRELAGSPDRQTALWAAYALAEGEEGDPAFRDVLRRAAAEDGPDRPLAQLLSNALESDRVNDRLKFLDEATLWLRDHHPDAAKLWSGWKVEGGRLLRAS